MKNAKHLIIGLIIAIAAIYFTFRNISFIEILQVMISVKYIYIIPILILTTLSFVLRTIRWKYLIASIKDVEVKRLYSPLMIGFMGNLLPARAGEFIRAYLLGKRENISFSSSFATIFIERLFDMMAILLIASVLLFYKLDGVSDVMVFGDVPFITVAKKFGMISSALVIFIITFSLLALYCSATIKKILTFITKSFSDKITEKVIHLFDSFSEGLHILKDVKGLILVILLTLATWATIVLSNYMFFLLFDIQNLPLISVPILTVIICIFIAILPTPGYVGSYQAACVVALYSIFHVPESTAASFGIVSWFITMAYVVVAGTYFILKDNISLKKVAKESAET